MQDNLIIERILSRLALIALIVILVLTVLGVLGLTELIAVFMLFVISHQMTLDRWLNTNKINFEEVDLRHANGLWCFRIGNNVCYLSEESVKELHDHLGKTLYSYLTSDKEDDHVF